MWDPCMPQLSTRAMRLGSEVASTDLRASYFDIPAASKIMAFINRPNAALVRVLNVGLVGQHRPVAWSQNNYSESEHWSRHSLK
jgi:hypothetical protein